jgi:S-DNA-T family DNA segregation ATPase FtsK/SpoIIIE
MRKVFLVMVVSAMLVTLGFAQAPDAGVNAGNNQDPSTVKGCVGGSDGNYTVAEDGTHQTLKITTSSVDLKPHVGHDVKLVGHKTSGTVSSGAADSSFAVTELSMISEHCAAAAAAGSVAPYSQTVVEPTPTPGPGAPAATPAVEGAAPAATVSPDSATASTPAVDATAPAATVSPSSTTPSTPAVEAAPAATVTPSATVPTPITQAAAPAAEVSPSPAPASKPAAETAQPPKPAVHAHKRPATQAVDTAKSAMTVSPSAETVSPPPAETAAPIAAASPSAEPASTPDAAATTPPVTHRAGSLSLLISFVVLVVVLGTLAPLIGRWRKRKMLERNGSPNLSFTNEISTNEIGNNITSTIEASNDEAISGLDKPGPRKVA